MEDTATATAANNTRWIQLPRSDTQVSVWVDPEWRNDEEDSAPAKPSEQIKQQWRKEQYKLATQLILHNDFDWDFNLPAKNPLKYIGGVDISFGKGSKVDACATVTVLEYPSMNIVWETYSMVKLTAPYIAGLLAFREVPFILDVLERLKKEKPKFTPQLLMVDGNGIMHMRGFGQACHLGVLSGIPCIGVAKTLLYNDGIDEQTVQKAFGQSRDGKMGYLYGSSGTLRAVALKIGHKKGTQVVYISSGHKIDMDTSVKLVRACLTGNDLPEPVYQADRLSREFLRLNYQNLQ